MSINFSRMMCVYIRVYVRIRMYNFSKRLTFLTFCKFWHLTP